jgi:hypothetical protein
MKTGSLVKVSNYFEFDELVEICDTEELAEKKIFENIDDFYYREFKGKFLVFTMKNTTSYVERS